ncbi:tetratricopeptide repeat protein [Deinococcus sp. YIM 134068]|uniref:tetratricopeptide repeat protein n=1 Tax=Deinococcus lichenicola TaxID=3118910 RepID=UPI002F91F8F5
MNSSGGLENAGGADLQAREVALSEANTSSPASPNTDQELTAILTKTARAAHLQGLAHAERQDGERALACFQEALGHFGRLGDHAGQRETLEALGRLFLQLGEIPSAEHHLETALTLTRQDHDDASEARILNLLAGVSHRNGAYTRSLDCLKEALEIHSRLNNRAEEANLLCNIGVLQISLGAYPDALTNLTRSYHLLKSAVQNEKTKGIVLINLGLLYLEIGEPPVSLTYFQEALRTAREREDRLLEANATLNIGMVQEETGDHEEAELSFREALHLSRTLQYRPGELSALDGLGSLLAGRGQLGEAAAAHAEAVTIAQEIEDLEGELDALNHLGQVQARLGDLPAALDSLGRALTLAQEADHKKHVFEVHRALSGVHKRAGDFERALHHHERYHEAERALFNEESDRKTSELSAQFDVERARHETEVQRIEREVAETAREQAEALVRERTHELEQAQVEIVTRLAVAAEYRDDLTGEHTWRVGHVSALIAQELGLPPGDVALLRIAARLHDVGKIGIPDAILLKPGKFTPEEFERMKAHTLIGGRILSGGHSRLLRMAEEIAESHHECWDGGGYPHGRAGHSIPVTGRIVSVADVFDALTSERPYKKAWTPQEALTELRRHAGTQFDPEVVEAGMRVFTRPDFARLIRSEADAAPRAKAVEVALAEVVVR